jgi:hypothetical protein
MLLAAALVALPSACGRDAQRAERPERKAQVAARKAPAPAPKPVPKPVLIVVPDDPDATYTLLSVERKGPLHSVVTMRTTEEETSFARREIRCGAREFRYTDEAESLAGLSRAAGDGDFLPVSRGSPSWHVVETVCGRKA